MASPITIHQNNRFQRFISLLEEIGICRVHKFENSFQGIEILDDDAFYDVFCVAFILYLTPENDAITVSENNNLIYKGGLIQLKITDHLNEKAAKAIAAFNLSEDVEHEPTFNIMLSIYIASQYEKLSSIYPNPKNAYIFRLSDRSYFNDFEIYGSIMIIEMMNSNFYAHFWASSIEVFRGLTLPISNCITSEYKLLSW